MVTKIIDSNKLLNGKPIDKQNTSILKSICEVDFKSKIKIEINMSEPDGFVGLSDVKFHLIAEDENIINEFIKKVQSL